MVYLPKNFRVDDLSRLQDFMDRYDFATILSFGDQALVSHLPLVLDRSRGERGTLVGHLALANPHARALEAGADTLCIFHGPHAYISPGWYPDPNDVPTWNYAVVHARGHARLLRDPKAVDATLAQLVQKNESRRSSPWEYRITDELKAELLPRIAAFEIEIASLEGKFKLSQNRIEGERMGAIQGLESEGGEIERELARLMRETK